MPKETADGEPYKPGQTKELNMEAADTEALTACLDYCIRAMS